MTHGLEVVGSRKELLLPDEACMIIVIECHEVFRQALVQLIVVFAGLASNSLLDFVANEPERV